jgi:hypothetical protein
VGWELVRWRRAEAERRCGLDRSKLKEACSGAAALAARYKYDPLVRSLVDLTRRRPMPVRIQGPNRCPPFLQLPPPHQNLSLPFIPGEVKGAGLNSTVNFALHIQNLIELLKVVST